MHLFRLVVRDLLREPSLGGIRPTKGGGARAIRQGSLHQCSVHELLCCYDSVVVVL